jgi:hypothetical protein
MGGGSSGKGGVADATLNVVPFIDLLACTICFLLISAVWTQMSRVDVDQALPKASKTPPKEQPKKEPKINVAITPSGYLVNLFNLETKPELAQPKRIPTDGEFRLCRGKGTASNCQGQIEVFKKYNRPELRKTLAGFMKEAGLGDKVKVMVVASDKVQYLHLIGTLDAILSSCIDDAAKKNCLRNPAVGDQNLLKAEGFTDFN